MTAVTLPSSALLGRRERLWPMVAVSLAVHVVLIGGAIWRSSRTPTIDPNQKPIVARLVRQGELRPKEMLPRKDAAPPPAPAAEPAPAPTPQAPPPAAASAPAPAPKAAPKPAAASSRRSPADAQPAKSNALASAMSRMEREQKVYGNPDGHALGDADEGDAGDQYLALVTRALQDTYTLPATISDQERMHLRATVVLYIEPDGRVSRYAFETRSGNGVFDSALERAIKSARLPPPPSDMRERYRSQGLAVLYRP